VSFEVPRITSPTQLAELLRSANAALAKRENGTQVKVHLGTCGISSGASEVLETFVREVERQNLTSVTVGKAACIGQCAREPIVTVITPDRSRWVYAEMTPDMVPQLIRQHLIAGKPVKEWLLNLDAPLFKRQVIRIMHNQDHDPSSIEEYIAGGGYMALARVLSGMTPEQVIEEVKKSGLRGRGGAGFSTATKWEFVRKASGSEKFVVCNGDEGDPGAYMNRAVLEGNPHSIIEGMAIGAFAIGNVKQGFAYIRAEYPLAIETLSNAIRQAHEYGLLGSNIMGTGFDFSLDIFPGAGAFVCGEETALLASIEGKRGMPRQRPPFPANKGLFDKPTTLNNVETWSNIPLIINNGAAWFASVGNEKCKGTKTFCLVGKVNNTGLIEVPLGTTIGEMVFDIGGGMPKGRRFKAVQIGGPSGGVIPIHHLNTPLDYEAVTALGAIMGSGGLIVMDEDNCMVDVARFFLQFSRDESCGKCTTCRAGIPKMLDILTRISRGQATIEDIDLLSELGELISAASLCGLGQTAPNPVLSTLRHFREEYEAHVIDKKCPAAVCQSLFRAPCQHTCPVGLDVPGYVALIKAGQFDQSYRLIRQRLPFPSVCGRVCHHPCEGKCRRGQIDEPVAIRHLKRAAADYAMANGVDYIPAPKPKKNQHVAIVGAGPAGLSAAWDLAAEGYSVTVFEALPVAGGMMAVGIPEYRLPRDLIKHEIETICKLGISIKLNSPIKDVVALLRDGFQAVFIASGAHRGEKIGIPGEELEGVWDAIEFLREANLGHKVTVGGKVAVIGGGNSAMDAARVALRKGAGEVHVFYRREKTDMPALPEEVLAAEEEGIQVHSLTLPTKLIGRDGRVMAMECVRLEPKEFDRSGRRTPYPIPGSEFTVDTDMVIEAIGQSPDTSFLVGDGFKLSRGGTIVADPRTLATGVPGIFAGGDVVTGPQTVTEAIAAGQRAASSIKRFLEGKPLSPLVERSDCEPVPVPQEPPTEEELKPTNRVPISEIDISRRRTTFEETVAPYTRSEAMMEASRCLRCDLQGEPQ